uniref:Si:dkey-221l4.10 n=1 Tax=Kryptolebias marmoratus TaxID=37003 RepID=A0A3Q3A811_KRYMA
AVTKSQEQILIQSGAMIALIVIGVIIILTVVLIILKTYNRTHASRLLGGSSKPRAKLSQSTGQGSLPLNPLSSVSGSITNSNPASETRLELSSAEGNHIEQFSTTSDYSGSTVVTIHDTPLSGNT